MIPILSSLKGRTVLIKIIKYKMGSPSSFLRWSCRKGAPNAFSPIFERGLGRVSKFLRLSLKIRSLEVSSHRVNCARNNTYYAKSKRRYFSFVSPPTPRYSAALNSSPTPGSEGLDLSPELHS